MSSLWMQYVYAPCLHLAGPDYVEFALVVGGTQCLHLITFWAHRYSLTSIEVIDVVIEQTRM